eukprot:CAMPEP_0183397704 /NCGR_PEP_ID=MMETSP0370-20130417/10779_1 /TAXON_ID=268820 /ORGANISM="Peridinium aciculiferum, Strain PAER-2" /LENGTH=348 /DNA_ID=CAMNT_0025578629 /DNA_START=51 /DNA_END=1097 /DNA_ORIENTATION=+
MGQPCCTERDGRALGDMRSQFQPLDARVVQRVEVAPGLLRFCLAWRSANLAPKLLPGEHLKVFAKNLVGEVPGQWCGKADPELGQPLICRRYTPIASGEAWHDILVEVITKTRASPDGGKFSRYAQTLDIGDTVSVSGPHGLYSYGGKNRFQRRAPFSGTEEVVSPSHVAMVASGAAVTTVIRLASAIAAESPAFSPPTMWLFLATDSVEAAAPHRKVLEGLVERLGPSRIRLSYTLGQLGSTCSSGRDPHAGREIGSAERLSYKLERQGSTPQAGHRSAPQGWPYAVGDLTDLLASAELPPTPSGSGGSSSKRLVLTFGSPATKKLCEDIPRSSGTVLWHWNDELDD